MKDPEAESLKRSFLRSQGMSEKDIEEQLFKSSPIYQVGNRKPTFTENRLEYIAQEELKRAQESARYVSSSQPKEIADFVRARIHTTSNRFKYEERKRLEKLEEDNRLRENELFKLEKSQRNEQVKAERITRRVSTSNKTFKLEKFQEIQKSNTRRGKSLIISTISIS